MKKLIKQDLLILLSLIAAYHPEAAKSIDREAQKLTMQETRDFLFLLRDGQCRICPFSDVFRKDSRDYRFWLDTPKDAATVRALHLHINRIARDSPEGSIVILDYGGMRRTIEKLSALNELERQTQIIQAAHRSLTRNRLCSTLDFITWLKGVDETWTQADRPPTRWPAPASN